MITNSVGAVLDHESIPTAIPHLSTNSWKVKVFLLEQTGEWLSQGIGQCQLLQQVEYNLNVDRWLLLPC